MLFRSIEDLQSMFNDAWAKALSNPSPLNIHELIAYRNALFQRGVVPYYGLDDVEQQFFNLALSDRMTKAQKEKFFTEQADKMHKKFLQLVIASAQGRKQLSEPLISFMSAEVKSVNLEAHRLLPDPLPLAERHALPLLEGQPLQLLAGPERIEAGWWDGMDVARDYYLACASDGARLWVYRDRQRAGGWYLHGIFG